MHARTTPGRGGAAAKTFIENTVACMGEIRRVAMVSMHTSPADPPGSGDAGGMNVAIRSTAVELAKRGVRVDLLTRATGRPRILELAPGVTVHELAAGPVGRLPKERLAEASDEFGEAVATLARRAESRYDLIHAHYWRSGIATLPATLELGIPLVQTFHTVGAMRNRRLATGEQAEPEIRLRSETYLANQSDAVIANSALEVSVLIDQVGAPAGRVWVVPPGVDAEFFSPVRAISESVMRGRLGVHPERPIVVVAGRVQPLKGQDLAIRALASMSGDRPLLVIAGEPTPGAEKYLGRLQELASETGVEESVRFTGSLDRESLADLLAAASLTLVPSYSETFGLVALESAASGTPVIATTALGQTGAVATGISGVLMGSRDAAEWGRAITALLDDPLLLAELSASARLHAEGYSWGATAAGLLGIYASLR